MIHNMSHLPWVTEVGINGNMTMGSTICHTYLVIVVGINGNMSVGSTIYHTYHEPLWWDILLSWDTVEIYFTISHGSQISLLPVITVRYLTMWLDILPSGTVARYSQCQSLWSNIYTHTGVGNTLRCQLRATHSGVGNALCCQLRASQSYLGSWRRDG